MTGTVRVGCSSWTSEAWNGRLYPAGLPPVQRLPYYARFYDVVEVDATYYAIPARSMVRGWAQRTPESFRFALKLPKELMERDHPLDEEKVGAFLSAAAELGPKLVGVVAQFPPSFRPPKTGDAGSVEQLGRLVERLASSLPLSVELRDRGWYEGQRLEQLRRMLGDHKVALAWSALTFLDVPPVVTTDRIYLRFIGDHTTISETELGELRVDRSDTARRWATAVRERLDEIHDALVFFNNHFEGYAPESANRFLGLLGRSAPLTGVGSPAKSGWFDDADDRPPSP
ncbi:MAG: DUF72 domain-containing protein [Thermoplasmata archaeon]|nr:DUF72 domain-containing protein [Thermoplasmata archaeon]